MVGLYDYHPEVNPDSGRESYCCTKIRIPHDAWIMSAYFCEKTNQPTKPYTI
jgi:hypothetical protein